MLKMKASLHRQSLNAVDELPLPSMSTFVEEFQILEWALKPPFNLQKYQVAPYDRQTCYQVPIGCLTLDLEQ